LTKSIAIIALTLILANLSYGQSDHEKYIQALVNGDIQLAEKIEKRNITTESIAPKTFSSRNKPEQTFHIKIQSLKDTIVSLFNFKNQFQNKYLNRVFYYYSENDREKHHKHDIFFNAETVKDSLFGSEYFRKPETTNDIYLHTFGESWPSKLYFSKGKPLRFTTAFIIKLTETDSNTTKISISAENPTVFNGIIGFGVHAPIARETKVDPSTIEEYTLLLFIADKLGEKSLQPLLLPKDN
jgi:hypothetical protein